MNEIECPVCKAVPSTCYTVCEPCYEQLQAELATAREDNYSGCVHTIETAVDREGCCTSCGEDLNYLALMQTELDTAKDQILEYEQTEAAVCPEDVGIKEYVASLQAENERLREFARHVIQQECWSILDLDGGDIQELAEKLGLIVSCTATEEDVDEESDFEVGDIIFKFSQVLKQVKPDKESDHE